MQATLERELFDRLREAATAPSMVRLLVSRIRVMTIPLMMLGDSGKGAVQLGVPTRRNE